MSVKEASGVFLFYGETVLLCKRAPTFKGEPTSFGGYWSPFTGSCEKNENPISCAVRELREESRLILEPHELKYFLTLDSGAFQLHLYAHELKELFIPTLDLEHTEFGYFSLDSLHASPSPMDTPIREAIKHYDSHIRL